MFTVSYYLQKPTRSKLLAKVQNCRENISKMDGQLKGSNQRLRESQDAKQTIDDSINQLLTSFPKLYENVRTIADEKNSLKKELESKERECKLLIEMRDTVKAKDQQALAYNKLLEEKHQKDLELLEEKIIKKRKKIKKLKEELQRKESELQAAQQEARTQQAELSVLQAQLRRKHDDMKNLQNENEKLTSSCNSAREQVSTLIQLTVTLSSDKGKMEV